MSLTLNSMAARFVLGSLFAIQSTLVVSAEESECQLLPVGDPEGSNFEQQFTTAEQLRQTAASAGAEWLKTEELLLQSRAEAKNENWSPALQLAQKACQQAELALQQAEYESEAWKHRVVD
jgi:hypothetical protein